MWSLGPKFLKKVDARAEILKKVVARAEIPKKVVARGEIRERWSPALANGPCSAGALTDVACGVANKKKTKSP